jgi:hypothetical protein
MYSLALGVGWLEKKKKRVLLFRWLLATGSTDDLSGTNLSFPLPLLFRSLVTYLVLSVLLLLAQHLLSVY